jgi:hypothetical protein
MAVTGQAEKDGHGFVCRFAVGQDGLAYSAVWRVWTGTKTPDLYIAVRQLGLRSKSLGSRATSGTSGMEKTFWFQQGCSEHRVAKSETARRSSQSPMDRL